MVPSPGRRGDGAKKMILKYNIGILVLSLFFCCSNPFDQTPKRERDNNYIKGVNFTSYSLNGYQSDSSKTSLNSYINTGGNWVAIIKTYYQDNINSSIMYEDAIKTPDSISIRIIVGEAKQLGLKVFMVPHVDIKDGSWRGAINPDNIDEWFRCYIGHLSLLARQMESLDVELLSIGSEFKTINSSNYWHALIDTIKTHFTKEITYCANWDEYNEINFWGKLDYVGIDWYAPLCSDINTSLELEQSNLELFMDQLGIWAINKKVLFTEVGFPSINTATLMPWSLDTSGVQNWEKQAECYRLILETTPHREWFAGIFWWEWEAEPYIQGYNLNFNPKGKYAENVLCEFWK